MLELKHITKQYQEVILNDISYTFEDTGLYVIVGKSGCGKSSLLNIIGGLDNQYKGDVLFNTQNIRKIKNYIRRYVGFIFQDFKLLDEYHVKDNYSMPQYFKRVFFKKYINVLLKKLDLQNLNHKSLSHISGGQKQRVAIMRSIIANNQIILCDEPTGALDQKNSEEIFRLLYQLSKNHLVIIITHDMYLAKKYHHQLIVLDKGQLNLKSSRKKEVQKSKQKTKHMSFVGLTFKQFFLSFRSHFMIIQTVMVSLLCILITFSLTNASRVQIKKQIEQLIPSSQVIVKKKDYTGLTKEELSKIENPSIIYRYLENNDCEMLGIGIEETYDIQSTLYIGDCTKELTREQIMKGKVYQQDNEIVMSQNTYQNLLDMTHQKDLLYQKVKLWYQKGTNILAVDVKIVGITHEKTLFDTLYFQEYKNIDDLKILFQEEYGHIAMLQLNDSKQIQTLQKQYPQYDFQISNQNLTRSVDQTIDKLEMILLCFCSLAIVSSCFLIGEVFYLMVVKQKRMYAIFRSLGASKIQILCHVFLLGLIIVHVAFFESLLFLKYSVFLINDMIIQNVFPALDHFFVLDYSMIFIVYIVMIFLTVLSCMLPAYKACQYDVIKGLKA